MYAMCVTVWSDHKVYFANWKNVRLSVWSIDSFK